MIKRLLYLVCLTPMLCTAQNKDSLIKVRQEYVWGDVKFGADYFSFKRAAGDSAWMGKCWFSIDPVTNEQNKVLGVELKADTVDAGRYHEIIVYELNSICDIIKMQYGSSNVDRSYPTDPSMIKSDEQYVYKTWNIGTKKIAVGVHRGDDNTCNVFCTITSDAMNREEHNRENERLKEAAGKF